MSKFFCYQFQETLGGKGCTVKGVCGKSAEAAILQDKLIYLTKKLCAAKVDDINKVVTINLFSTITNANFDAKSLNSRIETTLNLIPNDITIPENVGVMSEADEDKRSLKELITYGLKGMSAYLYHANALGYDDEAINKFMQSTLAKLLDDMSVEDLKLAQLRQKLVDSNITSDFEGTVTAVNVEVGENSTGVLFVVEDTSDLILTARVPEKDINSISSDMAITVTPKADNSGSYKGVISRVADSSEKNASGKTDTSGEDAEYKVTIVIEDPDERIRIGMNADAEFTVFEQEGCFTVPKDAVYKDEEGSTSVLAVNTAEGSGTVIKTPVSVVYAGKSMNVIEGSGIASGTRVLTDASAGMELVGTRVNIGK